MTALAPQPPASIGILTLLEGRPVALRLFAHLQWWIAPGCMELLVPTDVVSPPTPLSATVVVVPELVPELGSALIHLLEAGVPLISPDTAEARRLLGSGALFVSDFEEGAGLASTLQRILVDREVRETQGRKGRAQARRLARLLNPTLSELPVRMPVLVSSRSDAVSVIIPTAGGENVERCVAALRTAAGDLTLQVILVVTGGAGTLPPCDELVRCEPPFVWAAANNAGLRVATAPWVLLLNDDAFFAGAGDLCRLLQVAEQWPYLAAIGPVSPGISTYFQQYAEAPIEGGIFVPTERPLCGHCLLVRRECFASVGEFDETFVDYGGDELDWLYRARQHGYRWGVHEGVFVEHLGAATFGARAQEWQAGRERFESKHGLHLDLSRSWTVPQPEVSWVITSHEGSRYLSHCLDSLRACSQGLDYEIVLAVDGSDRAPYEELLRHYRDLPLRVVYFPKARSVGEARNRALRLARGGWIFPFDDDDVALAAHRELLEAPEGMEPRYGELLVYWDSGECSPFPRQPATFEALLERHGETIFPAQCASLPRAIVDRYAFREDLPACEDYELWLRLTRDGFRLRPLAKPVTLYFQRPGSCSKRTDLRALNDTLRAEYARYVPAGAAPERPVYSYVITAWNEAERLGRCLESLLACAPVEPYEVVLADDGSTDATLAVASAYLDRLPLRIHPFPKAPTVAAAYNRVLRLACGEYLLLMDADDETTPERVPRLRAALDRTGADFVYGSYTRLTPRGPEPFEAPDWERGREMEGAAISPCAALFHRRILDAGLWFREELPAGEDRVWMLDIDRAGFRIEAAPQVMAHWYRMRPDSIVKRFPVRAIVNRYGASLSLGSGA